jgi:hypothetical protein
MQLSSRIILKAVTQIGNWSTYDEPFQIISFRMIMRFQQELPPDSVQTEEFLR